METKTRLKMKLFTLCLLGVVIMCLPTTTSASEVFYNSVSSPCPENVASLGFEPLPPDNSATISVLPLAQAEPLLQSLSR